MQKGPRSARVEVPVVIDIEINRHLDPTAAYTTLAHELGHVLCGHLGSRDPDLWPDRAHVSEVAAECEAEAVAYIAALRLDPAIRMPPHLAGYLKPGSSVPPIDLELVTKAAGDVIALHESPEAAGASELRGRRRRSVLRSSDSVVIMGPG